MWRVFRHAARTIEPALPCKTDDHRPTKAPPPAIQRAAASDRARCLGKDLGKQAIITCNASFCLCALLPCLTTNRAGGNAFALSPMPGLQTAEEHLTVQALHTKEALQESGRTRIRMSVWRKDCGGKTIVRAQTRL